MSRHQLVEQALQAISQLPEKKISEVVDFATFILKKHEETILQKGIERLVETSDTLMYATNSPQRNPNQLGNILWQPCSKYPLRFIKLAWGLSMSSLSKTTD